ncbi:hypothetical protein PV08_05641 [Exophiala spinifera]|uniref:Anaphase-promoting complex subunit 2 n=1 Tax=Exophiala spinifera TaxID=91928 RepID=A0A0D2B9H5_9EURO|nr:uncharacterized protein PV08_05641 [Exophiala spinifera]KIW15593.1 hypothetical protein PV08_05641 [Exophiala spinifera]
MSKTEVLPSNKATFASVFSQPRIRPPKHPQRFTATASKQLPVIKSMLKDQLRSLLGIGNEDFVYGNDDWIPGSGGPFRSHFGSCPEPQQIRQPTSEDHTTQLSRESGSPLWPQLERWKSTIGSSTLKKQLASVLIDLLAEFITWSYAGVYREGLERHLDFWVEHLLSRIAKWTCSHLEDDGRNAPDPAEVKKWKDMATARLGALRVDELFTIVVEWDATAPAIEDLRAFTTNPATRAYLTQDFANVLQARLLHPGASTVEILQIYISIIRAFRILDPKGVLLDRVARKLRRYLRERDDTVKVIVVGLLSDPGNSDGQETPSDPTVLTELAVELNNTNAQSSGADDADFDWNNMDWVPDPIDAAPDYAKTKNDVIGSLITLFDTKEVFVRQLQSSIAERLLKKNKDFEQEISVLEHLKLRFGDAALQGCEVMLRDVLDSRKVDTVVRRDRGMHDPDSDSPVVHGRRTKEEGEGDGVHLHAKILSRLFWPAMPEQGFTVPRVVQQQQESYEAGFEALKQNRKLTWINSMGQVEVELEFEDRTVVEEVLPWHATVIYAFQDASADDGLSPSSSSGPVSKTVAELAAELNMSATHVRMACVSWVSKRVLAETSRDTFVVLDRLPDESDNAMQDDGGGGGGSSGRVHDSAAAAAAAVAQAAKEAEEEERKAKMAVYHQFVVSMLTNQGAMPLSRIAMMLGIVVPGGFPFSNEELKEFLAGMVKDGVLDIGHGGAYKIAS